MQKMVMLMFAAAMAIGVAAASGPAQAQATRTYVSGGGSDASACTARTAPCLTLQRAHDQTTAGGEVTVLDTADYGILSISKSISIVSGDANARILQTASSGNAIFVNGASSDIVNLRGLVIDGGGTGSIGINISTVGVVNIQNCVIRGFRSSTFGIGVAVSPNSSAQIHILDTIIADNGNIAGNLTGGLSIAPGSSNINLYFTLTRVQLLNNLTGLRLPVGGIGGATQVAIKDSVIAGNLAGSGISVNATAANAPLTAVSVKNSQIVSNGTGILANGAQAVVILDGSTIQANSTALTAISNGAVFSYGNNTINDNGSPGSAPTVIALH